MLQTYSAQGEAFYDGGGQSFGLDHYLGILKRRALYFVIPFGLVLLLGSFITAIQRPIYRAEGKILVESQEIPTDLVRPTVTDTANERIQVIEQRIMTRDNLLALVNKYGIFARERQWMSGTELLDLMRERTNFSLVDSSTTPGLQGTATIAFTVSFEYENPGVTLSVANDLLTLILNEDARNRTNKATETTNFLTRESQRLQGELAAVEAQITENQARPHDEAADQADPAKLQVVELTKLREELAQKSSVYSDAHPYLIALKKKIAAMEQLIAKTPSQAVAQANSGLVALERQQLETEKSLEDTNKKLEEARLGEKLERDQQSERLQVIEQPILPQSPVKPNRIKLLGITFALAMAVGAGAVLAAQSFDASIRHSRELVGVANGRLIVSIPYIATQAETLRKRSRLAVVAGFVGVFLLAGVVGFLFFGPPIDLSWVNQFWLDHLTRLSK
jgi:capsular polysaccharide biosynthesis protein